MGGINQKMKKGLRNYGDRIIDVVGLHWLALHYIIKDLAWW